MSPLALIPPQYQLLARVIVILLLAAVCFGAGCQVTSWHDAAAIADVRVQHANAIADAKGKGLAQLKTVTAERDQKAAALSAIDIDHHEQLTRLEHENDRLRTDVGAGTRIVRVRATCPDPGGPAGVPQAAAGGRVDPGAGAVLDPEAGRAALDLRGDAIRVGKKLDTCQAALGCITGQRACPPSPAPVTTHP